MHAAPSAGALSDTQRSELAAYLSRSFTPSPAAPAALPHPLSHYSLTSSPDMPQCAYLLPDFISPDEEAQLLSLIDCSPSCMWTRLKRRRLQMWGGHPSADRFESEPLPVWQSQLIDRLSMLLPHMFPPHLRPDHVLLNEYEAGQGIMPHRDGPLYHPRVAILSLRSHTVMRFYRDLRDSMPGAEQHKPALSVYIPPRSLFLFTQQLYETYFHAIEERAEDELDDTVLNVPPELRGRTVERDTRLSLTIRRVRAGDKQQEEQSQPIG